MNKAATIWEVFIQSKNGLAHKHVGNVHAEDKEMALQMQETFILEETRDLVFG